MSDNQIKVAHVEHIYEAEGAVAALTEENIVSAYRETHSSDLLAMPGAMGIPDKGYDIIINECDRRKAREILIGIGVLGEEEAVQDEAEYGDENGEEDREDPRARLDEQLESMGPIRARLATFGAILLLLLLIAFCTWGVDAIIAIIRESLSQR